MKLIALHIYQWKEDSPKLVCHELSLDMLWFYQRGMAKEHITFSSRTVAGRIPPGNRASVTLENNVGVCYCWTTSDNICATAMTDQESPEKAAFIMLNKIVMDFRDSE